MNDNFVIVWRTASGNAVETFAYADKRPRVFSDLGARETKDAIQADHAALTALLEDREPFNPRIVFVPTARELLGWDLA